MRFTCDRPTLIGARSAEELYEAGMAVSTAAIHREQARTLNPDLKKCGRLPGCADCGLPAYRQRTFAEAMKVVAIRGAEAVREADLR